jgi:hypothetical protein
MCEGGNVCLLHDIFGLAVVSQHTSGNPIKAAVVPLHDRAKGIGIAGQHTPHQLDIVQNGGGRPPGLWLGHGVFLYSLLDAFAGKRFPAHSSPAETPSGADATVGAGVPA